MQTQPAGPGATVVSRDSTDNLSSGVSWGAILAGAAAAAALSFILLILGMGLGLSSVSPYEYNNGGALGTAAIVWIAFTQLAAAGIGGYMAGRLRAKWAGVQSDEVHFRDTAHGLLAWAVATLVTVAVLAGGMRAAIGGAIDTAGAAAPAVTAGVAAAGANSDDGTNYFSDMVLRSPNGTPATDAERAEINRILLADLANGKINADDRNYLAQTIAKRTGLTQAEAEQRVDLIYAQAKQAAADVKAKAKAAAEEARKAAAHSALWMFVALLLGAFVASLLATIGGRHRDHARVYVRTTI